MKQQDRKDVLEIEKQFAEMGGNVQHYRHAQKMKIAESEALVAYQQQQQAIIENESKRMTWAAEIAAKGLNIVAVGFTFVFVLAGSMLATIALFVAEYVAVLNGFSVIEPVWAWLYSLALVGFYIVTLFIQEIVIARHGYVAKERFSLRTLASDVVYFFGGGQDWQLRYNALPDNAQAISQTIALSAYAIITFGLLGRLDAKLEMFRDMAWHQAIQKLVFESNLEDILGYAGMFIATAALLYSTKWVVSFMYGIFRNVTGGVTMQDFSDASLVYSQAELVEMYQIRMLQREMLKLESRNRE